MVVKQVKTRSFSGHTYMYLQTCSINTLNQPKNMIQNGYFGDRAFRSWDRALLHMHACMLIRLLMRWSGKRMCTPVIPRRLYWLLRVQSASMRLKFCSSLTWQKNRLCHKDACFRKDLHTKSRVSMIWDLYDKNQRMFKTLKRKAGMTAKVGTCVTCKNRHKENKNTVNNCHNNHVIVL